MQNVKHHEKLSSCQMIIKFIKTICLQNYFKILQKKIQNVVLRTLEVTSPLMFVVWSILNTY